MVSWIYLDVNKCQHVWERHDKLFLSGSSYSVRWTGDLLYWEGTFAINMQYTNKHMH